MLIFPLLYNTIFPPPHPINFLLPIYKEVVVVVVVVVGGGEEQVVGGQLCNRVCCSGNNRYEGIGGSG